MLIKIIRPFIVLGAEIPAVGDVVDLPEVEALERIAANAAEPFTQEPVEPEPESKAKKGKAPTE